MRRIDIFGFRGIVLIILLVCAFSGVAGADDEPPLGIGIEERLGERLPLDAVFQSHLGDSVRLIDYFSDGKPVVLSLVYHRCPMLCNLILDGKTEVMKELQWTPGDQYRAITLSFSDLETPEIASSARDRYTAEMGREIGDDAWAFLVGDRENIRAVTDAAGFGFKWDEPSQDYAHGATLIFISPDGRIARYLYGIQFAQRDFRTALLEASEGRIGSALDRVVLYCFQYDSATRSYVPDAINIMKLGGLIILMSLGTTLFVLWRRERNLGSPEENPA